jgi:hypothetical protein
MRGKRERLRILKRGLTDGDEWGSEKVEPPLAADLLERANNRMANVPPGVDHHPEF